jgi:hypothetical protein
MLLHEKCIFFTAAIFFASYCLRVRNGVEGSSGSSIFDAAILEAPWNFCAAAP